MVVAERSGHSGNSTRPRPADLRPRGQTESMRIRRPSSKSVTRGLLRCGVAACPIFVSTFVVEGALRDSYDPVRRPISALALGPYGWVQSASFETTGATYLAAAVALAKAGDVRAADSILVGAAAAGLLGAGIFAADAHPDAPPGVPSAPGGHSTRGVLHDAFSGATLAGLPVVVLGYSGWLRDENPGWARYSIATAMLMLLSFGLAGAGSHFPALARFEGLLERVCATAGLVWLSAQCARALAGR